MLSIKRIGCSSSAISYYANLGQEEYYVGGAEPPGTWWGNGAEVLGLKRGSIVEAETFRNLLTGLSIDGATKLVQNAGSEKRLSALDLTWSAPKSVSAAWSAASAARRKQIESASERALHKALGKFDELCGVTRRGKAGERTEKAGLVGAVFRHNTSRGIPGSVPDPNLHWHVVICNVATRSDGSTGSLDARELFRKNMKMALGAMFRAELSKEMEQLGLFSYRPERNGRVASWFELSAVPPVLVDEFSKRRKEIEKWLRKNSVSGAKAAEKAATATRREKESFNQGELFDEWRQVAAEHGLTERQLEACFQAKLRPRNESKEAQRAVADALNGITSSHSHFSKLELIRFAAEASQARGVGIDQITEHVSAALSNPLVAVRLQNDGSGPRYTTPEMLAMEKRMLDAAIRLAKGNSHHVSVAAVDEVVGRFPTLRAEQADAIRHITSTGGISCVNGMAGTGKTFMLNVAREAWEGAGLNVIGTALAAKAAKGLQSGSGIESVHIHRLLREIESGERSPSAKSVIVVDEAGMVGTRLMDKLVALASRSGSKLVLIGDHRQLQAIEAGSPFRGIAERVGSKELSDIIRQRSKWARKAVAEFAEGKAESALGRHYERGLLDIADDREEAMERIASDWVSSAGRVSPKEILAFVGTRMEASAVNRLCQDKRRLAGHISQDSISCGGDDFHIGDRVIFTRNNAALFVDNGSTGTVVGLGSKELSVQLDDGLTVRIDIQAFEDLSLGYAVTTHKGQGVTVERSLVLAGGPMTDRELSYVQGSRARGTTKFYTDVLSGGEDVAALAKQMAKSRAKDLAHDYVLERT